MVMSYIFEKIILIYILCFSKSNIIYNPIVDLKDDFLIKFNFNSFTTSSGLILSLVNDNNKIKYDQNYYYLSPSIFLCEDESYQQFIFSENKLYDINWNDENEIISLSIKRSLASDVKFNGYIKEHELIQTSVLSDKISNINKDEIIIYGTKESEIYFYYIKESNEYLINGGLTNDKISCKFIKSAIYICVYVVNNNFKISILVHIYESINQKAVKILTTKNVENSLNFNEFILHDTDNENYKVLCVTKKKENGEVEFKYFEIFIQISYSFKILTSYTHLFSYEFNILNMNNYESQVTSYEDHKCYITRFNNEYLLCCGSFNIISCTRKDNNFNLNKEFSLNLVGDIHNIFISISSNQAIISYINETSRENYIYHYYIYIPKCYDIYKNVNSTQELEFDLDELFDRKTNTKYYIKFNNLLQTYGNIKIGEEIIELTNNITEIKDGTKFYFISTNNNTGDNLPISYEISNEETYSSNCNIYLTIKDCYPSCKTCSKYDSDSNFLSQNCIECKEEDNYFPFPEKGSNCYKESEMASTFTQWFFDEENSIFKKCHPDCSLCNGTSNENCLICYNANLFLYNGKCIENCPENIFKNQENKKCEDCYKNCKTCGMLGYLYDMGCISCLEKEMIFNNYENNFYNCFKEYDNNTKSFYVSEEINNISSCFELYGRYIIENTYECIEKPDRGYFISNQTTGLLSPCPQNCFACNNSNICDLCENDYLIQAGKCVLSCSKGYYQYYNICLKYYQNNEDSNKGIVKSINQSTSLFEFKSIIKNNITGFVNSSNLINGSDFLAIISTSDNTDPKEQLKKGISSFNLDDCIEVIKTHYNISKEENLIILNIESKKM